MRKILLGLIAFAFNLNANVQSFEVVEDRAELEILSPTLAERKTAKIRLSNGLEAYLVSDPEIDRSAAALAVRAGSWDDPEEYPGMAHFLEHMLFMGTEAYPDESEYIQYITDNGGTFNAYTASDRTVYMFSVNNEAFEGALDRFSHFFIDPLFSPACINRELHAVDQEFAKNIEHDGWRQYHIFKETGNPDHPNAKFSTGNTDTLSGIPQEAMKTWYKKHYSANKMHLIVLSSVPINQLIEQTVKDFSNVPMNPVETGIYPMGMISEKQKGEFIYIKPIKNIKVLSLVWELPKNLAEDNEAHVGKLISYVLGSGSKNSLLSLLKRKHLAESIRPSEDPYSKSNKLFTIDIELTDQGLKEVNTVITYCFETLARLKKTGIPRYIFSEVQRISEINYQYQSRIDAFSFVKDAASDLVDEDLSTYPKKTLIPTKFDPQLISSFINYLTPENCVYFVLADPSKTEIAPTKKEKWMKGEYAEVSIPQKQLVSWTEAHVNSQIGLPPPNPFIPKTLTLVNLTPTEQANPSLLQDNSHGKVYYSEDKKYLAPEVAHFFKIKSPLIDGSPKSKALSDLYIKALKDQLFPTISAAKVAGSSTQFKQVNLALAIKIDGYSDQSSKLVEEIFNGAKKVQPTREQFELYKKSLLSNYENTFKELPIIQSFEIVRSTLFNDQPTSGDKLDALKQISYEDFNEFAHSLFKKAYLEGLIYGNLTHQDAQILLSTINKKLKTESYPPEEHHKRQILVLPQAQGPYMLSQSTPMLGNAAVLVVEQGPFSFEKRASQEILGRVLKESFFDTLRTKQQTAYITRAIDLEEEKQLLQLFAVQSSTHQPGELIARFELFLENFIKQFNVELSPSRFENVKKMAIASLQMPPENLELMGARLFTLAFDYEGDFQYIEKRIASIEKLTYEETKAIAEETLSRKNTRRIAVLMDGMTPKEKDFRYELISKEDLRSQGTYVAWK